ncbi:MAG: hypothetical protein ACOC3V_00485 [bacterium]
MRIEKIKHDIHENSNKDNINENIIEIEKPFIVNENIIIEKDEKIVIKPAERV